MKHLAAEDYIPSKQPMTRKKPSRDSYDSKPKFKDDKRRRREAVERKRGE